MYLAYFLNIYTLVLNIDILLTNVDILLTNIDVLDVLDVLFEQSRFRSSFE